MIQSVMAICNALAAVESQEITAALNQMPPCPSRMQPKIQKVSEGHLQGSARSWEGGKKKLSHLAPFPPFSSWKIPE